MISLVLMWYAVAVENELYFIKNELADLRRRVEALEGTEAKEVGTANQVEFIMNRMRLMEKRISFLERVRR